MQEDIERRAVAVSVTATKLTGRVIAKALSAALKKIQTELQEGRIPQGRQSVKKLMNHNVATNTIPLDGDMKLFDRIARKFNVDYAIRKTGPDKYLLFFKAGQADAITACFAQYSKRILGRNVKPPSITGELKKFGERVRSKPREPRAHERTRKREVTRDDR